MCKSSFGGPIGVNLWPFEGVEYVLFCLEIGKTRRKGHVAAVESGDAGWMQCCLACGERAPQKRASSERTLGRVFGILHGARIGLVSSFVCLFASFSLARRPRDRQWRNGANLEPHVSRWSIFAPQTVSRSYALHARRVRVQCAPNTQRTHRAPFAQRRTQWHVRPNQARNWRRLGANLQTH